MRCRQLLQRHLRAGPQLGDDLPGAESAELPAPFQAFPLGVAVQEASGVEVSSSSGVQEITQ